MTKERRVKKTPGPALPKLFSTTQKTTSTSATTIIKTTTTYVKRKMLPAITPKFLPASFLPHDYSKYPTSDTPQIHMLAHQIAEMEGLPRTNSSHFIFARRWCKIYKDLRNMQFSWHVIVEALAELLARYKGQGSFFKTEVTDGEREFAKAWVLDNSRL